MKALDEYFLLAVFTLLLSRGHGFANFMDKFGQRKMVVKGLTKECPEELKTKSHNIEVFWWSALSILQTAVFFHVSELFYIVFLPLLLPLHLGGGVL